VDQKHIDEIKKKNPDAKVVEFNDGKVAIFSKPSRTVVALAALNSRDKGPMSMVDTIIQNCWLDGDEEVRTDAGYALGLMSQVDALVGTKTAEIKN
jgi:hypothetical protein